MKKRFLYLLFFDIHIYGEFHAKKIIEKCFSHITCKYMSLNVGIELPI